MWVNTTAIALLVLFASGTASLLRLSSIGALSTASAAASKAEGLVHSLVRAILVIVVMAALARAVLSPAYPGGVIAFDASLAAAGAVSFLSSIPAVGLIALLARARPEGSAKPGPARILITLVLVAVASGSGQLASTALAARVELREALPNWPLALGAAIAVGLVTCFGVWLHFRFVLQITSGVAQQFRLSLLDAASAAGTTVLSVLSAAIFWKSIS